MTQATEIIETQFLAYMLQWGADHGNWYVGVASDARTQLFTRHGVDPQHSPWICRRAESADAARAVQAYFAKEVGTDGGVSFQDEAADQVYAYRKGPGTDP